MSRLLARIDAEIAQTSDQVSVDCLRAERAAYLARQGRFDEAKAIVQSIRERYGEKPNAKVASWLHFVEGLTYLFGDAGGPARDKIRRAFALASAAEFVSMQALCSGWLAHLSFGLLDVDEMTRYVKDAFRLASDHDHHALSRASLVCAVALHLANRYDLAKPWYSSARSHASAAGDETMIGATMHNMTSMSVMNLRQAVLAGASSASVSSNALLEVASTSSYDELVGTVSLSSWAPILQAGAASLLGDWERALELYSIHADEARRQGQERLRSYMHADVAWCRAQTGAPDLALKEVLAAEGGLGADTLVDDRAATHSRLAGALATIGLADAARDHAALATEGWADFSLLQARIVQLLGEIPSR
jgi:hypothetical protein